MNKLSDSVKLMLLPYHREVNGGLVVVEEIKNIPFRIARVFTVLAPEGAIRGQHAHKKCTQFLTCPNGQVEVLCDDGVNTITFLLDDPTKALLISPGIWAQQTYIEAHSVLNVFCDQPYDEADYLRDYDLFKNFRKIKPE